MARIGRLSRIERLAVGVAAGLSIRSAAKRAKIAERTAHRRAADPAFSRRVNELRAAMTVRALGILTGSVTAAARRLRRLLKASAPIALRAAVAIIDMQTKLRQAGQLEERVSELERRAKRQEDLERGSTRNSHRQVGRNGTGIGITLPGSRV
jgi:hypothetical protein